MFGSQKYEYCHVLSFLIKHSFTELKHYTKGSNKIAMCESEVANAGSPTRCSRSWYLLNNKVYHKSITWITTWNQY